MVDLFGARAARILGGALSPASVSDYLSGLPDWRGVAALRTLLPRDAHHAGGEPALNERYRRAMAAHYGVTVNSCRGMGHFCAASRGLSMNTFKLVAIFARHWSARGGRHIEI